MDSSEPPASDLVEAMVRELEPLYGRIDVPDMPSARPEYFGPPCGAFVACFDEVGRPVCGGGVKRLGPDVGEIKRMFVVPEARGRGLGRALLERLLAEGASAGLRQVVAVIAATDDPASVALHRACGFREAGRLEAVGFKHGAWHDTIFMQRSL